MNSFLQMGLYTLNINSHEPNLHMGFPCSSFSKEFAYGSGILGLIAELGRSSGEGNGNPLQYSFLGNLMDRRAWWAAVHGVSKSRARLGN